VSTSTGGWSELLAREHRAAVSVFAGGILVFAINTFLTSASLPSTVADIGGEQFYAWVVTVFLIASVVASMLVTRALAQFGARGAYLIGFSAFAAGSLVCALTPTMPILLAGRLIQGLGGGLLTGLAFAVVQIALPQRIWGRAVALISAMWGVGNIVGPAIGGMFAEVGLWRGSFWFLTVVTLAIAAVAGQVLPRGRGSDERHPLPWASLAAVTVAAGAVSVAAVSGSTTAVVVLGAVALLALAGFVAVDRHGDTGLLPRLTYSVGNPLKWIYLSIAVLAAGSTAEAFLPLFGQQVGGLSPFAAGLLPAALSTGWTVAQIASSTWARGHGRLRPPPVLDRTDRDRRLVRLPRRRRHGHRHGLPAHRDRRHGHHHRSGRGRSGVGRYQLRADGRQHRRVGSRRSARQLRRRCSRIGTTADVRFRLSRGDRGGHRRSVGPVCPVTVR
jgi:MFS family permease